MRTATLAALLAALALVAAACGNGNGEGEDTTEPSDNGEATAPEDDRSAELDDDVAAVVNGEEILADDVDGQVDAFAENPQIAEQLEGEDGDQTRDLLRSQVLTTAIVTLVAIEGAEELDRPVTDEDVAAARDELQEETGGAEAFEAALEQEGLSEEQLAVQLRGLAALRNIQGALDEEADESEEESEEAEVEGAPSPSEQRAQQFVTERLAAADVVVNDDYGMWDPQTGNVSPPGGVPAMPPPEGDPGVEPEADPEAAE